MEISLFGEMLYTSLVLPLFIAFKMLSQKSSQYINDLKDEPLP